MPPPLAAPSALPPSPRPPKRTRWVLYGCGTLVALLLVVVATVAITVWWIQRPIKPVQLSPSETAVVEEKLRYFSGGNTPAGAQRSAPSTPPRSPNRETKLPAAAVDESPGQDRFYVPGSKVLRLTERELNGLLNANTDLGKTVRLEFTRDAINAYLAVPIPEDFPVGGGKMFRARGRFRMSLSNTGAPYAILDDVTVLGLSLPNAWLGGLKGENLIGDALGKRDGSPIVRGIKSLRVEPGALVLELED